MIPLDNYRTCGIFKFNYLFLYLLLACGCTYSQQHNFQHLNLLKLPSQECYFVTQDSAGYIWIATLGGLCVYDGKTITVFNKKSYGQTEICYAYDHDEKNNLIASTTKNTVLRLSKDTIKTVCKLNERSYLQNGFQFTYFVSYIKGSVYAVSQNFTLRCRLSGGEKNKGEVERLRFKDTNNTYCVARIANEFIPMKRLSTRRGVSNFQTIAIYDTFGNIEKVIELPSDATESPTYRVMTLNYGINKTAIAVGKYLIRLNHDYSFDTIKLKKPIISLYADKEKNLWVGTLKGGVYFFNATDRIPVHDLPVYSVSGIWEDHEGGVWCSTLEAGIFYTNNKHLLSYSNLPGLNIKPSFLKTIDNTVYCSVQDRMYALSANGNSVYSTQLPGNNYITDITRAPNNQFYILCNEIICTTTDFKNYRPLYLNYPKLAQGGRQIIGTKFGYYYIRYSSIGKIQNGALLDACILKSPGRSLSLAGDSILYIGCKDGLYAMRIPNCSLTKYTEIKDEVSRLQIRRNGDILMCLAEEGFKNISGHRVQPLLANELGANRYYDVLEDKHSNVWGSTNEGLLWISADRTHTLMLNATNKIGSNEVQNIACDSTNVFFSSPNGVYSIPFNSVPGKKDSISIILTRMEVNGTQVIPSHSSIFSYGLNNLTLYFDILAFNPNRLPLKWKLNELSDYQNLESGIISLSALEPGDYSLFLKADDSDSNTYKKLSFKFTIEPPFWRKWWFYILCITIVLLTAGIVFRIAINKAKQKAARKNELNRLLAEYKLSALQAQMNPHFIFNAINSIQHFILSNESQLAYDYLAKFASLVRKVLYYSRERITTMEAELETLQLYVEFEEMRFSNKFKFELNVSDDIDTSLIPIPAMLIQPYVENAIWHGIMPLKDKRYGKVSVTISQELNKINIEIFDNGVGRAFSKKMDTDDEYLSLGMSMASERVNLLKHFPGFTGTSIKVVDHEHNNESIGTSIIINYEYNPEN